MDLIYVTSSKSAADQKELAFSAGITVIFSVLGFPWRNKKEKPAEEAKSVKSVYLEN